MHDERKEKTDIENLIPRLVQDSCRAPRLATLTVKGNVPACGTPTAMGLVPKTRFPPLAAATNSGEFAIHMPINPCRALATNKSCQNILVSSREFCHFYINKT
jgi:hypothetical protein